VNNKAPSSATKENLWRRGGVSIPDSNDRFKYAPYSPVSHTSLSHIFCNISGEAFRTESEIFSAGRAATTIVFHYSVVCQEYSYASNCEFKQEVANKLYCSFGRRFYR